MVYLVLGNSGLQLGQLSDALHSQQCVSSKEVDAGGEMNPTATTVFGSGSNDLWIMITKVTTLQVTNLHAKDPNGMPSRSVQFQRRSIGFG